MDEQQHTDDDKIPTDTLTHQRARHFGGIAASACAADVSMYSEYHERPDEEQWSLPLANLMMVMFAIVLLMTGLGTGNDGGQIRSDQQAQTIVKSAPASPPATTITRQGIATTTADARLAPELVQLSLLESQLQAALQPASIDSMTVSVLANRAVRVTLPADSLFETDTDRLTQQATAILDRLASTLATDTTRIQVIGHTDDQAVSNPVYTDNWALSSARAVAVTRYLVNQGDIAARRLSAVGRAQYAPLTSNLIASSRAQNRRIDIVVHTQDTAQEDPGP